VPRFLIDEGIEDKKQYQTQCKKHDAVLNPKRFYNKNLSVHIEIDGALNTATRRLSTEGSGSRVNETLWFLIIKIGKFHEKFTPDRLRVQPFS